MKQSPSFGPVGTGRVPIVVEEMGGSAVVLYATVVV